MKRIEGGYNDTALVGLDGLVGGIGRHVALAVGCHKDVRRSKQAIVQLIAARFPVANTIDAIPTVNYADFLTYNFEVTDTGLMIPRKTDYPFAHLLLFHDGGDEEGLEIKRIKDILDVEAKGMLQTLLIYEVRDQEGLMGLA